MEFFFLLASSVLVSVNAQYVCGSLILKREEQLSCCLHIHLLILTAGLFLRFESNALRSHFTPGCVTGLTSLPDNTCLESEFIAHSVFYSKIVPILVIS